MIGVCNTSILLVVSKRVKTKALFVSQFSPEVSSRDIEKSLKEQLKLSLLACTRLKTKFNTYVSFHISVTEDDFPLIYNTGVWPDSCLIAQFYGQLNPDQIFHSASSTLPSPRTSSSIVVPTSGSLELTDKAFRGGTSATKLMAKYCDGRAFHCSMSSVGFDKSLDIFYQNVRGLTIKQIELLDNVYSINFDVFCLTETWQSFSRQLPYFQF